MTTTTSFGLSQIGQIAVTVRDLEEAIAFYRDTLGMRFLFRAGTLAFFDCGGVRLMLGIPESTEFDHPASVIYYRVEDVALAYEALRARGVAFEDAPHKIADLGDRELWMAFLRDPAGNLLAIMAEPLKGE